MSKKASEEHNNEKKTPPPAPPPPSQCQQLCDLLSAAGIGYESTHGKVAIIVGKHAGVDGKIDTVATFEHDDAGKIFRVTLG